MLINPTLGGGQLSGALRRISTQLQPAAIPAQQLAPKMSPPQALAVPQQQVIAPVVNQPPILATNQQPAIAPQQQFLPAAPATGLIGSEQALGGALEGGISALRSGLGTARADLQPFVEQGAGAFNLQAALTGAAGQPAQQEAFDNFQNDPSTQFLQQQGDQAVLRNQAAIGGLGGGNVRRELSRFNQGLANQQLQQRIQNLGTLGQQGLGAAGQQAGIAKAGGLTAANLVSGIGRDVSQGRLQTGRDIANQVSGTTSALSQLINQQGQGVSSGIETSGLNLANILQGSGAAQSQQQTDLARLLANLASQQATQSSALPSPAALLNNQGILGQIGQAASGIGAAITASDLRLKTNVQKIGETSVGHNLYMWDWNEKGQAIAGKQSNVGVIAQEVMKTQPEAVMMFTDGYLRVDYSRVN